MSVLFLFLMSVLFLSVFSEEASTAGPAQDKLTSTRHARAPGHSGSRSHTRAHTGPITGPLTPNALGPSGVARGKPY